MDLIEIDAASNRTIDDMRLLKETIGVSPTASAYKVYLVDEAHMITKEASNAFLKMLEEPPAHVVFILATTEAHKLIPTVLSRVQRFDFKKLTQQQIVTKLSMIAEREKFRVGDGVLASLAAASDGALRDAEVMLGKLAGHAAGGVIDETTARSVLGLVPISWHATFLGALQSRDRAGALRFLQVVHGQGADMDQLAKGFLEYLRQVMIVKIDRSIIDRAGLAMADAHAKQLDGYAATLDGQFLVRAISQFSDARTQLRTTPVPTLPLELAVIALTEPAP
jgi:DNA polymerase-3 subunit gamma/tau